MGTEKSHGLVWSEAGCDPSFFQSASLRLAFTISVPCHNCNCWMGTLTCSTYCSSHRFEFLEPHSFSHDAVLKPMRVPWLSDIMKDPCKKIFEVWRYTWEKSHTLCNTNATFSFTSVTEKGFYNPALGRLLNWQNVVHCRMACLDIFL